MTERAAHGATDRSRPTGGTVTVELGELAHAAVVATAPDQIDLYTAATARRDAGAGHRRPGWTGGSIGSGLEPVLLAEVIGPILLGASAEVLGAATVATWRGRRRWFRRGWWSRRRGPAQAGPRTRVTLDADQVEALRSACVRHGTTLGLSEAEATLLADAVHGALCRALADAQHVDE
ncbi:hypothetical protein EV385_5771 [Krasilnikovia cinnamomea]|uniref:Uncharacterized protein n=1 Tax=Krasilnikovia cinnamomea TaxID=349313 RepID=A0A4Q7ZRQ7_9ACTN|nr:hypothetical protein [Krasilnikovia cinnamomea]RZU53837.1 hypothetical protein EV385_5771 [Krasilnikovia cinnamomea]